ncbi:MAG TPA: RecB-family nuclease [Candidatus Lokiarchaeia archaeon]|nr:RecB-family nuclease [Candidatus Lokiarchaeia archaeon]
MSWKNVYFVLHAPDSARVIKEFTRIVLEGFDKDNLILTRVMGGSSGGIEGASKDCYKMQKNLLVLRDLDDLQELIQFDKICIFPPPQYATGPLDVSETASMIKDEKKIAFVFGAGKVSGLTRKELGAGDAVKIVDKDIGPLGTVAILVHDLDTAIASL